MSNQCSLVLTMQFPNWDDNGAEPKNWSTPRHIQHIRCGYRGFRGWNENTYRGAYQGHWIGRNNECRWFCSYDCLSKFYLKAGYDLSNSKFIKKHKNEEI